MSSDLFHNESLAERYDLESFIEERFTTFRRIHCDPPITVDDFAVIEQAFASKDPRLDKFINLYRSYFPADDVLKHILEGDPEYYYSYCKERDRCETGWYRCGNTDQEECKNCCIIDGIHDCYDLSVQKLRDEDNGIEYADYEDFDECSEVPCSRCGGSCDKCKREALFYAAIPIILELIDREFRGYGKASEHLYLTLMDEITR